MGSYDFITVDKFGKNSWTFFWSLVLEFDSFLALSGLDLAPWQKVDLATLGIAYFCDRKPGRFRTTSLIK